MQNVNLESRVQAAIAADRARFSVLQVITEPRAAFAALAERPGYWLALGVTVALLYAGFALQAAAYHHVSFLDDVASGRITTPTAATQQPSFVQDLVTWTVNVVLLLVGVCLGAVAVKVVLAVWGHDTRRRAARAVTSHVAIVTLGLSAVAAGVVFQIIGAASFQTYADLERGTPSLLLLFPSMKEGFASAALSAVNPFAIWSVVLYALAFRSMTSLSPGAAYLTAAGIAVGAALLRGLLGLVVGY